MAIKAAIILVRPLYQGNIGAAARAMKNFGFNDLVLIGTKPDQDATIMAVHAKDVLDNAKHYKTLKDAAKDFDFLVATTCRITEKDDYFLRMDVKLEELKKKLSGKKGKIGIVFGCEDTGLLNHEMKLCDVVTMIPTSKDYKSMNLSHAVAVMCYELSDLKRTGGPRLASAREKSIMLENIGSIIDKIGFYTDKKSLLDDLLGKFFGRAALTGREANTLIGILKRVDRKLE